MSAWDDLNQQIRSIARHEARKASPPIERFKVLSVSPLAIEQLHGELVLQDGDPDFEVYGDTSSVSVGDTVIVHTDGNGDYVLVLQGAAAGGGASFGAFMS